MCCLMAIRPSDGDVKPFSFISAFDRSRRIPAPDFSFNLPYLSYITLHNKQSSLKLPLLIDIHRLAIWHADDIKTENGLHSPLPIVNRGPNEGSTKRVIILEFFLCL